MSRGLGDVYKRQDIPTKLNQEQKDALMAYEKALTGNERHGKKKGLFGK